MELACRPRVEVAIASDEPADGEVVDDILRLPHVVLDSVDPLPQRVVLEVQQLEASVHVPNKAGDAHGQLVVAQGDGVSGQTAELLGDVGQGEEVLLDGDVEGIFVLEVDGD